MYKRKKVLFKWSRTAKGDKTHELTRKKKGKENYSNGWGGILCCL